MEQKHSLHLTGRNNLNLTGISGVDSMSDTHVIVNLPENKLTVKGCGLNVNLLDVEEGKLVILGESINGLEYGNGKREKFSFRKLFK